MTATTAESDIKAMMDVFALYGIIDASQITLFVMMKGERYAYYDGILSK